MLLLFLRAGLLLLDRFFSGLLLLSLRICIFCLSLLLLCDRICLRLLFIGRFWCICLLLSWRTRDQHKYHRCFYRRRWRLCLSGGRNWLVFWVMGRFILDFWNWRWFSRLECQDWVSICLSWSRIRSSPFLLSFSCHTNMIYENLWEVVCFGFREGSRCCWWNQRHGVDWCYAWISTFLRRDTFCHCRQRMCVNAWVLGDHLFVGFPTICYFWSHRWRNLEWQWVNCYRSLRKCRACI